MIVQVAFYKAFAFGGSPKDIALDMVIGLFSRGLYSHVELILPNGQSFSTSPREGTTRFKEINYLPERWDIIDVEIRDDSLPHLLHDCRERLGVPYDYMGAIFSIFGRSCLHSRDKYFCSEVVADVLSKYLVSVTLDRGCSYTPVEFREVLL